MAVRRWDPFRDLLTIQNEMNRLFGRTFGPGEAGEAETQGAWVPPLDVYETEPLEEDLTFAGPLKATIHVSTTGTDADWVLP